MDLPPLSLHDSLEEQWVEEEEAEEIETMLKVVPTAYHKYLNALSKVKEVKLPPHCACDHHIELDGLLPPVGVISIKPRVRNTEGLHFRECRERYHKAKILFNNSTCRFFQEKRWGPSYEEEQVKHVASVLQRLRNNNLFANASKCVFHASGVEYLGYVVSSDGLKMDSSKAQQIWNLPQPKNIKALQYFLGFANFYHCFIKHYSKKITSLTSLLKKNSPFILNEKALSQFHILKEAFTTEPTLSHFNPYLPAIVETDASEHPIAFDSRKLLLAELNYEIHDKEPLAIVWALKCWRYFLLSLSNYFEVLTDHSSPHYFMSSKVLTCCRLATLPDSLSHRDNVYPKRGADFISKNPQNLHQLIKQYGIQESRFFSIKVEIYSDLVYKIQKEVWQEKDYKEILKQLARAYGAITALQLAQIFISHVFSKHGLPVSIVSDRRSLFVSSFWSNLCQNLKIARDLSTSFHPETDGKTERVNQILEKYIWMYVSYHQDYWYTWLPLSEFAHNNAEHLSTNKSLFFTIYGRNLRFDSIYISQDSPSGILSTKLQLVQKAVKEELESAIRRFKKYADRNRSIPPDFQPGDKVWLASKNIKTTIPTKKLSERWLGPFEVIKKIGSHAYQLKLPFQRKSVHSVLHVSLLEPVKQSSIPNCNQFPQPPLLVEEQ
ncbi:hypothetical protein O181_045468 [Austropuccinia psidii MF-1]|uniref:Integrase catalytic domain-containing protein n=1 Tax=Austropuccinia psidii MF-1 TaxID=1389203 RepID=A0A9Q3DS44_9BASI|nr:hypothetical protein [Austropuccinia psidii MF-1]